MRAFSLIELSIVLVILGLLTGSILAGQSLIRAAELRAVTSEYQRYAAAIQTFRDKYMAIPGDFQHATRFWEWQSNAYGLDCATNSSAVVNSTTGVCDGNGNQILYPRTANASIPNEAFQFWRHLAAAGLIEGKYTGIAGSTWVEGTINNSPASHLNTGAWFASGRDNNHPDIAAAFFAISHGNTLQIGGLKATASPINPIFTPSEQWGIDTKIDDGSPARGKMLAIHYATCTTATGNTDFNATYKLATEEKLCVIEFPTAF